MIYVDRPKAEIPKPVLMNKLKDEASAILHYLMELEIPKSNSRLRIPVVETKDKQEQANENRSQLDIFIEEYCCEVPGLTVPFSEFLKEFQLWLPQNDIIKWPFQKVGRQFPKIYPRGRYPGTNVVHIGNFSLTKTNQKGEPVVGTGVKWVQKDDRIYPENDPKANN